MSELLKWYNLIFYIPLTIGLLSVIGVGFSGAGHDVGVHGDFHADADHDAEGDHDGESQGNWILGLLGIGRVPIAISFMTLNLIFAGTGICMNTLLGSLIKYWGGFAIFSVIAAIIVMFFGTAFVSRTVGKLMPTTETDSVTKADLLGCTGVVTLACDKTSGLAQIRNGKGDLYQIQCRSDKPLPKGTQILTVEYEVAFDTYLVVIDPTIGG